MQFELSADQQAMQAAARELLDEYASPTAVRSIVDAGGGLDPKLWAAMVDQGWAGVAVPEPRGGLGMGWVELAVLLEQTGAHVAPAPFLQQVVALDALVRAGGHDELVSRLIDGEAIATVAAAPVAARPEIGDDGIERWTLSGATEPALFAPRADVAVVLANDATDPSGDGVLVGDECVLLVDLAGAGLVVEREPAMDLTRELGWLRFDETPATLLGRAGLARSFRDAGAVAHSCELLGASAHALDLAVAYANEREQFGRPIGSFQAVKHRCADMLVDVEGMRSAAYYAAWCLSAGDADRSVAASTAKTWCSDASKRVMASALQVHGGIGFTWECDVHFFLKRAQADQRSFGDASFHRGRLGSLLRAKVEAGESVI
ncbi:MAG: acyl-CoA dehydrogenase family protein [Actinobacteria bacterium]|nr:acyl-CoA dehydrogenase family protein [Actinomycetota bacterium]